MIIEMGDNVPTVCSTKERASVCFKWTKSFNTSLVTSIMVVLGVFICGVCVVHYCIPCAVTKQASSGDLTATPSNVICFQSQIPVQAYVLSMCNITFIPDDGGHLQHTIQQGIFDFLLAMEEINKSLPPFSEGGVIMLCKDLVQIIQQLENDIQNAVKHVKKLQESLKPKQRRRPPPRLKT